MTTKQLAKKYFEAVDLLNSQIQEREKKLDGLRGKSKVSRTLAKIEDEVNILKDMRDEAL